MDKKKLNDEFVGLVSELRAERDKTERKDFRDAYESAIILCQSIIEDEDLQMLKYEKLSRFVSDSLPWTGLILQRWNKIKRIIQGRSHEA